MELLYQVNQKDHVLGSVERVAAHTDGILHRAGIVFLYDDRYRVFLTRRKKSKEIFPGFLDSSASFHVQFGETNLDAATRELKEELGLDLLPFWIGKFTHFDPPENQIVSVFGAKHRGETIFLDSEEFESGKFYPMQEAGNHSQEKRVTPWLKLGFSLFKSTLSGVRR